MALPQLRSPVPLVVSFNGQLSHPGLAGSKRKEVGVQEIDLDAESMKQTIDSADPGGESAHLNDDTGANVILRPIRIERSSDDEDDLDVNGEAAEDEANLEGSFGSSDYDSERSSAGNQDQLGCARSHLAPSTSSACASAASGSSQVDTIIID